MSTQHGIYLSLKTFLVKKGFMSEFLGATHGWEISHQEAYASYAHNKLGLVPPIHVPMNMAQMPKAIIHDKDWTYIQPADTATATVTPVGKKAVYSAPVKAAAPVAPVIPVAAPAVVSPKVEAATTAADPKTETHKTQETAPLDGPAGVGTDGKGAVVTPVFTVSDEVKTPVVQDTINATNAPEKSQPTPTPKATELPAPVVEPPKKSDTAG